jgi:SNF2 family DNA or RNA helicase
MARRIFTPHEYQRHIVGHILDVPRCAVWAGMGLGKTSSTLSALDMLFLLGESRPALVLAPLRVARSTWPDEVQKWEHLAGISIVPIVGSEDERRLALKFDAPIYSCNYDNLPWLVEHFGERWPFATVISDESTRLKSFRLKQGGARARALGRVAHTKVKRFVQLTGTPSPNGLADLWGQMWFLDAGQRLGRTYESFRQRWFQKSFDGYSVDPLPFAHEQIQDKLRDICLTVDAKDWFDLDEPIVNNIYVDLPARARIRYREMEREMFTQIEDRTVEAFGAAARTQKCLQLANGACYVDPLADSDDHPRAKEWREVHDGKLQALESIVEEANGMPVLVSYEFKSDLARILKAFPQARHLGSDPQTERDWNAGKIPMLLAHPKSAGHGLNLQDGSNIIVFFGHNWDLELYQQIIERIGPVRQKQSGHDRPVFIYHIIARDTVDEIVMARRDSKREVQDLLLEAMKRREA